MADENKAPVMQPAPTPHPTSAPVPEQPSFSEKAKAWFANNKQNVLAYFLLLAVILGIPFWWHYGESYRQVQLAGENIIEMRAFGGPDARWEPSVLELDTGKIYTLKIISQDVTHKFSLPAKQLDVLVEPGHPVELELMFEQPGEYAFRCNSWCGLGHQTMTGKIIVR